MLWPKCNNRQVNGLTNGTEKGVKGSSLTLREAREIAFSFKFVGISNSTPVLQAQGGGLRVTVKEGSLAAEVLLDEFLMQ